MTEPKTDWRPEQYHRFQRERQQPFFDLLALTKKIEGGRAVDLGCGTGELTKILHETVAARETVGIDNSPAMLEKCEAHAAPGLRFEADDIARAPSTGPFDLVFSNAALHWLDDHPKLLARLASLLAKGGQLAVQVPANFDHPSHTIAASVAREEPFSSGLRGYERVSPVLAPEDYASRLFALGFSEQHVRLQVYGHALEDRSKVIEWVKGTLLTDYEKRMSPELFARYLARYREALFEALPDERPFFFPFKRLLFWARRP